MKKFLILILLLFFVKNVFAWDILDAAIMRDKNNIEKQKQELENYKQQLNRKLREGFDGPIVTNIHRCYIDNCIPDGINIVTIDRHDYIIILSDYRVAIVHSESCSCKKENKNEK
jgi:hypothetical protein